MATKRKASDADLDSLHEDTDDDYNTFPYIPETPTTPSPSMEESGVANETSASQIDSIIEALFSDGIVHESQWSTDQRNRFSLLPQEQENIFKILKERFSNSHSLYAQLPLEDNDSLRFAFYNAKENWFHQLLERETYDAEICSATLRQWLQGDINTLVLCGGRLSNAKLLFNILSSCFPLAVTHGELNDVAHLADVSEHSPLYCVPFVESEPSTLMLHFMEGNSGTCLVNHRMRHVRATQMLIHCSDISKACSFMCRNTTILFLPGPHAKTPHCFLPRRELKDFITSCNQNAAACKVAIHCKRDNRLCPSCIEYSPEY
ncbi:ORF13 [turkey adenovirus 4]|uniref:ORF13 n=1 Tax=turkey adenovirus 4 TaxID=1408257 RepID=U5NEI2_9ADEN|nr:ORF13 [Turkey aviadenovirus 4]AGX93298.1 ORF13 [Turkey aviadenovirus 4]